MRLALTVLLLAAVSLFMLSLGAPVVFQGQNVALLVDLRSGKDSSLPFLTRNITQYLVADNTTKYFHEPGDTDFLRHYDVRFFPGATVSSEERIDTLYHMIRAYLSIFRDLHVETWIAHGTLLGWWWNSQILPWDSDLDVQVSGKTLAYMGEFLNYTTYSYKSGDVERQYFLDVNPYYKERTRGDGWNVIDARWIDTQNGLFIDITGISEMDPLDQPGIWACKNEHVYKTSDIWPLRESNFEGVASLVPYAYDKVLTEEYEEKALNVMKYEGYLWSPKLEKWIPDSTVPASEPDTPDSESEAQLLNSMPSDSLGSPSSAFER